MNTYTKEEIKNDLLKIFKDAAGDLVKEGSDGYKRVNEILDDMADSKFKMNQAILADDKAGIAVAKSEIESLETSLKLRTATIKTEIGTASGAVVFAVLKTIARVLVSTFITLI